jgi:DNA-binding MarR family transcriptional regulator
MTQKPELSFRILNWIGIINQLSVTLANSRLADHGLPWPQFLLLNHFSHRPDEAKTVTGIAQAMQQNQPAVSKTVQAMVAASALTGSPGCSCQSRASRP